jgi:uncharacterized protein with ACT and thioredoxin-like domain
MNLIQSANTFLDQVNTFYEVNDRNNYDKLIMILQARAQLCEISNHQISEHARLLISLRRLLTNTLPHYGFEERLNLEASLNAILETAREHLAIIETTKY